VRSKTAGILAFLCFAFAPAWVLWGGVLASGVPVDSVLFSILVVPGAFAPAIAAIIVRRWITREGFVDAGLLPNFHKAFYYFAAWLIPLLAVAFIAISAPILGVAELVVARFSPSLPIYVALLSVYAVLTTPVLWGEEFGWRSYLQLRLFPERPLLAAIATGLIWGVWHFPLLATGVELPRHPYLIFALFPVGTILYSIILGWLRTRSGTIWTASFAHSAINHVRSPLVAALFPLVADRLELAVLGLVPFFLVATAIVLFDGLKATADKREPALGA
jgi:membrane protease YdiL (CAAX protease family)